MTENLWRRRPLTENPYDWTAFQIVGLSPDVVGRRAVSTIVTNARKVLQALPGQRKIAGKVVEEADVTAASQILMDPSKRILEELLTHQPEQLPVSELQRFQTIFSLTDPQEASVLPIRHLHFFQLLIPSLIDFYMATLPPVDFSLPTEEGPLVPPYGKGDS